MVQTSVFATDPFADLTRRFRDAVAPGRLRRVTCGGSKRFPISAAEPLQVDHDARLQVVLAGRQRTAFSLAGKRVERVLSPGEAAFWSPDAWTVRPFTQRCHFVGLVFRPAFARLIEVDYRPGRPRRPLRFHHSLRPLRGLVDDLLRALNAIAESGDDSDQGLQRAAFTTLVLAVLNLLERERLGGAARGRRELTWQRVLAYLDERHRDAGLGRERAAAELGLNQTYLSELCSAQSGMAFNPYLRSLRVGRARHLLATSDLPVEEVARQTGFSSAGYFIKSFRREVGETPGGFRAGRGRPPLA